MTKKSITVDSNRDLWPDLTVTTGMSLYDSHLALLLAANCCYNDIDKGHANTHMHSLLCYPCCFQNVSSAWAVLIVLIVMNFLYIWQWILYYCYYYYYCSHSFSAHFWVGVDSTLLFLLRFTLTASEKKNQIIMIILVVVIRMIIPGLMSISQFVCNDVATTSQYLNHLKILHSWVDFPHYKSDSFRFFSLQTPYNIFVSMNVQQCASPPPHRLPFSPHLCSLCVSCCLSV